MATGYYIGLHSFRLLEDTEEHVSFLFNLTELYKDSGKQSVLINLNRWNKATQVTTRYFFFLNEQNRNIPYY